MAKRRNLPPPAPPRRSWQAHAIGAFIAYHLVAVTLKAVPTPEDGLSRDMWRDPSVQAELHAWWDRAKAVGFHELTYARWEEFLWELANKYCELRFQALRPFEAYYRYAGTFQAWPMFIAPQRYPTRFSIDVQIDGAWQNIFTEDDPQHAWMAREFGDTRFRSVFFRLPWSNFQGELAHFTDWVTRRAGEDFPKATRARVRLFHYRTPRPDEVLAHAPIEGDTQLLERDLGRAP